MVTALLPRISSRPGSAFSLLEVVLCLGLVSFCLLALLGLLIAGISQGQNAAQSVRASHLMSKLVAWRAASPAGLQAADGSVLALPPLTTAADSMSPSSPIYLGQDGEVLPSAEGAVFQLNYRVVMPGAGDVNTAAARLCKVWAVLSWPGAAPLERAKGTYEITYFHPIP